jgi:hypothetical protein
MISIAVPFLLLVKEEQELALPNVSRALVTPSLDAVIGILRTGPSPEHGTTQPSVEYQSRGNSSPFILDSHGLQIHSP